MDRLAEYQFTEEEAKELYRRGDWKRLTPQEIGLLQLRQQRLCVEFSAFHEGITKLLGRSVWTHEFAKPDLLWEEFQGLAEAPSFDEIMGKLPEHLRNGAIILEAPR